MTVREIAELAGVSIGTVDRVLYKRGRVSAETRAKVQGIIEQYQFRPNPIARRLKRNRAYRFSILLPRRDQDAGYWGQALDGIRAAAAEIAPLGVETEILEYDRYNVLSFQNAADKAVAARPDGLVIPPIMPEKTGPFIADIQREHIPYVFFDADMPGTAPLMTICQDSFKGGYLAGRLMHLFAGSFHRPVAVLDPHGEDYHIIRRRDGFLKYAAEQGIKTVVREYSGYKEPEISSEEIAGFFGDYPNLDGIFITNCMAHRVAEAVQRCGRTGDFILIGYDLIPKNLQFLKEDRINAIISQRPETQGREALLNLYRWIVLEQAISPRLEIPLDVYIRENAPPE
ncbi:MAG: LacI family transcriptional regulator [Treponema sp.]|jgi:LacI family transcriptional regulator|nr:LacI family transcriptional regulator [Treponema sp.]